MPRKPENFIDLIQQATEMLLDRSKSEQELIYHIAKMETDLRSAIVIAYQQLYRHKDDER